MAASTRTLDPELERILLALDPMKPERAAEVRRWTPSFVAWCRGQGLPIAEAGEGDLDAFRQFRGPDAKPAWPQTQWAIRLLVRAAGRAATAKNRSSRFHERVAVEGRDTILARAITDVVSRRPTRDARATTITAIGRFLAWCDARGVPARECLAAELPLFRGALRSEGMSSTDWVLAPARALVAVLAANSAGWAAA